MISGMMIINFIRVPYSHKMLRSLLRDLYHEIKSAFSKALKKDNRRTRNITFITLSHDNGLYHMHMLCKGVNQKFNDD